MSLFSRSSSIILTIALAACSARGNSGGGGGGDPDASTPDDTTTSMTGACVALCARVATTSGCPNDTSTCMTGCAALVSNPACASQTSAFATCANSSAITCTDSTPNFSDCVAQQMALIACLSSAPPPDASVTPDSSVDRDVAVGPDSTVTPDVPTQPDVVVRPDVPSDGTVSQGLCAAVCDHIAASPGCSSAAASCTSMCSTLSTVPSNCTTQLNNYLGCLTEAPIVCSSGTPQAPACTSVQSAFTSCLTGGPPDAGIDVPPSGDPTAACTTPTWSGTSRECGWRRGGTFSCTPGRSYTVGCNSTSATSPTSCATPIGACSGDPVLRVCSGATTCSGASSLTSVDDTCGTCPVGTVLCPSSGQITVLTGDFSSTTAGTCTVAIR